jgi:hypothetical protein
LDLLCACGCNKLVQEQEDNRCDHCGNYSHEECTSTRVEQSCVTCGQLYTNLSKVFQKVSLATFQQVFEKNEKDISIIESECAVVSFEYRDIKSTKKQKQKISVHKQISLNALRQAFKNFAKKEMRKKSVSSSICRKEEADFLIRKVTSTYWYNLSKYKKLLIHYAHFR